MKGIELCAECAYYNMKSHKCTRGCKIDPDSKKGEDVRFFVDCPLPDVQPVNQWISVNDRLPEAVEKDVNGKIAFSKSVLVYLVYDNGFTYITNDRFRVDSKSWLHEIPGEGCKVTHWMPLPEPPKDGDTND